MRHGLCSPKNFCSGQEYKHMNNSRQLCTRRTKWAARGTRQSPGRNWGKALWEDRTVLLQCSNPGAQQVLKLQAGLRTKQMPNTVPTSSRFQISVLPVRVFSLPHWIQSKNSKCYFSKKQMLNWNS